VEEPTVQQIDLQAAREASRAPAPRPVLPGYELKVTLGEGSFGQVWSGVQQSTGQTVAIKILLQTSQELQREVGLLREVAEHPHVVGLIDANLSHQPPFLVMPLLQHSLSRVVGRAQDHPRVALDTLVLWLEQAAGALQYVHNRGLLHCDLKPGNLLIDANQNLRVADFGQARQQHDQEIRLGTLFYMPWEQSQLKLPSTSWDIYALGATFYHLMTGRLPRSDRGLQEQLSQLGSTREVLEVYAREMRAQPLLAPRQLNPEVDGDLSAILEHCLEVEPQRRYPDMGSLLEDLRRRRQFRPLSCRPARPGYLASRFLRRNRNAAVVTALAGLALAGTVALAFHKVDQQRQKAVFQAGRAEQEAARAREALADNAFLTATRQQGSEALLGTAQSVGLSDAASPHSRLRRQALQLQLQLQPRALARVALELAGPPGPHCLDLSAGRALVQHRERGTTGWYDWKGAQTRWLEDSLENLEEGQRASQTLALRSDRKILLGKQTLEAEQFDWMDLSPDGLWLVAGEEGEEQQEISLVRATDAKELYSLELPGAGRLDGQFSPDGRFYALVDQHLGLHLFSLHPPRKLWTFSRQDVEQVLFVGNRLLVRCTYHLEEVELSEGKRLGRLEPQVAALTASLGVRGRDFFLGLGGEQGQVLQGTLPLQGAQDLALHPQSSSVLTYAFEQSRVALGCADGSIRVFEGGLKRAEACLQGDGPVQWLGLRGNELLAFCSQPDRPELGTLWRWQLSDFDTGPSVQAGVEVWPEGLVRVEPSGVVFHNWNGGRRQQAGAWERVLRGGRVAVLVGIGGVVRVCSLPGWETRWQGKLPASPELIRPDGQAALAQVDGRWTEFSLDDGRVLRQDASRLQLERPCYSRDGRVAMAVSPEEVAVYELFARVPTLYRPSNPLRQFCLSHDGGQIFVANWFRPGSPGSVFVWNRGQASDDELPAYRYDHGDIVTSMSLSSDGKTLATACGDGSATLWPLPEGKPRRLGHEYTLNFVDFSADGKLLVTCGGEGQVRLWDLATGRPLSSPLPHDFERDPIFTDGGDLVTVVRGHARVWNLQPWQGSDPLGLATRHVSP